MLYATLLLAVSALASVAFAQDAPNTTACCNIDPGSVPLGTRNGWCTGERNTCLEVCGGIQNLAPNGNLCDPERLTFTCTCSNGNKPNMSDFQQSLPAQQCLVWYQQCIDSHPNDRFGQEACKSVQCGNRTTADLPQSSSSASSSPTGTAAQSSGPASATSAAPSAATSGAAVALGFAREYGTPVLAAGIMAAFGLGL
jgi:hypothetical protein